MCALITVLIFIIIIHPNYDPCPICTVFGAWAWTWAPYEQAKTVS